MIDHRLTIRRAAKLLDAGLVNSEELASFCYSLALAGEDLWNLNAYNKLVSRDEVLDHARAADSRRKHGNPLSIFDGLPISIKANLAVETLPLTAGSLVLGMGDESTPAVGYDADTVQIMLRDCGAVLIGTASMDEFGMGSLGNTSRYIDGSRKVTRNPLPYLRNLQLTNSSNLGDEAIAEIIRMPQDAIYEAHANAIKKVTSVYSAGGSSCGSAASVSHGSALLSLGTDTGGSVRLPSAWCSLVGLKPSYGLLSRHGVVSYASSFDTVGILAKSTECAALAFDHLVQRTGQSRDSTASFYNKPSSLKDFSDESSLSGVRIGIPSSFVVEECPQSIKDAWSFSAEWLHGKGAEIIHVSNENIDPELVKNSLASYYILVSAEASSNLSRYDGFRYGWESDDSACGTLQDDLTPLERQYSSTRTKGFGMEVSRRILCGTSVLSSDRFHTHYEGAARLRSSLAQQLDRVLENQVDLLMIPTALFPPCEFDGNEVDSTQMFANDIMTVPPSLAGLPSISVPVKIDDQDVFSPSFQLIGARHREDTLLHAANVLELASR